MMAQFLGNNGFIVYTATSAREIREILDRGQIDLILLDVMLGEENGLDMPQDSRRAECADYFGFGPVSRQPADDRLCSGGR